MKKELIKTLVNAGLYEEAHKVLAAETSADLETKLNKMVKSIPGLEWKPDHTGHYVIFMSSKNSKWGAQLSQEGSRWVMRYRSPGGGKLALKLKTWKDVEAWLKTEAADW